MAHEVLHDSKIYLAHYDLSGDLAAISEELTQETPEHTNFSSGSFRSFLPGLRHFKFSVEGYRDYAALGQDEVVESKFAVADVPLLISPDGGAAGDTARFGPVVLASYEQTGDLGETAAFTLTGELSSYQWVRGLVVSDAATSRTGTFNGAAYQIGAVTSTQKLYAAIHVTAATAMVSTTIKIQSDDNSGMTTPTDRITFTSVSGKTSQFATPVVGPITDDYWRVIVSAFSGTSFSAVIAVGIQ